ncbi:bifunctional aconitate hydratase 2/2-methylisocitrate dehydratase [Neisseria gonorrhoeae]|uniref:Bifunctional aconitate hydratase 2/2-methylisocitrate dehydratase n=1 Tax=Neisseria gonorrhoeae TaxID=485 RepID=A0A378VWT2_NEIGO|nr:bifunctional aconitate hydratase 2/2-methylisocitrate dehydratase [Neisseria gonorrhoeae]
MLEAYRKAAAERAALGIPALPLNAQQTADLVELLKTRPQAKASSWSSCLPTVFRPVWTMPPKSKPHSWLPLPKAAHPARWFPPNMRPNS